MKKHYLSSHWISQGPLVLIHPQHPLSVLPAQDALAPVLRSDILLHRAACRALHSLVDTLGAQGQIIPVSGYRTQAEQQQIYAQSLAQNGPEFTRKYVALPGCSEHQSGLAIDLGEAKEEIDFIRPEFPDTGVCGLFRRLAPDYGFVQRYPKGKESLTQIAEEPWHFRYVGTPHARIMTDHGFVLEEYLDWIRSYSLQHPYAHPDAQVFFLPQGQSIPCPEDGCCYEISGNNIDGIICTIRRQP